MSLAAGRPFTAGEERPGARIPVVIVNYARWKAAGLAPEFVGSTLRINNVDFTVVGVTPEGFTGTMALVTSELWLPLGMFDVVMNDRMRNKATGLDDRSNYSLIVAGRVKPGVGDAVVKARLDAMAAQLAEAYPAENRHLALTFSPLPRMSTSTSPQTDGPLAAMMTLFLALSAGVLLVACLNIANMLLARGTSRRREVAVRLAVGAARGRIVRQLLTEGVLLSLAGAAVARAYLTRPLPYPAADRVHTVRIVPEGGDWRLERGSGGLVTALEPVMHGGGQELGRRSGTNDVASAVGIGRTTLYEYFRDKDDLIASLVEERLPVVVDEMIESVSPVEGVEERILALASACSDSRVVSPPR